MEMYGIMQPIVLHINQRTLLFYTSLTGWLQNAFLLFLGFFIEASSRNFEIFKKSIPQSSQVPDDASNEYHESCIRQKVGKNRHS